MPLQNRATPLGDVVAETGRGLVFGNRGNLHDESGRIRRRYNGRRWISCRLEFGGRRRAPLLQRGRYTELFFLDEATAFAAGHRPCAECRREDYVRFVAMWSDVNRGDDGADAIDARLHGERLGADARRQLHHDDLLDDLPDGAYVLDDGEPRVVVGSRLLRWTPAGYDAPRRRPRGGRSSVITPPSIVAILRAGWSPATVPFLHPSARTANV